MECGHSFGSGHTAGIRTAAGIVGTVLVAGLCGAVPAHADTLDGLKAALDAARSEAGCPPFQLDPKLTEVTDRTVHEVDGWVSHSGTVLPIEDSTVMAAIRQANYKTVKARMLSGYADDQTGGTGSYDDKAIKATVLQGLSFEVWSDCSYAKYGMSALSNDGSQGSPSTAPRSFTITSVIVASG
jgi:hypothetical protein